jgi:EspA/EspE family
MLDGFMSTWSKARETFGQGVPQTGERFDQSGSLRQMQTTVESAAPGARWSGTAASAYDTANTNHGKIFGALASLDQRLSAKVTESAQVVSTGRQNLDSVRQWVLDAAASVPPGGNREQLLLPIVKNGLGQVSEIVTTSNAELNRIGGVIKGFDGEYQALNDQRFGPTESPSPEFRGISGTDPMDLALGDAR